MFYLIKEGKVSCSSQGRELRLLVKGDFFGEQAMLYDCKRTSTVTTVGAVVCLSLDRNTL